MGVICSVALAVPDFVRALREGRCGITHLPVSEKQTVQIGALIQDFRWRDYLNVLETEEPVLCARARKVLNNTTDSTRLSACAAIQAFGRAQLGEREEPGMDCGIIVAGSNLSQDYIVENWTRFQETGHANPRYALSFSDSNQLGCLSEILAIRGPGLTVGAAAASGNAALFQAFHWIRSGIVQRCVVVGACAPFSVLEREAFAAIGAACCGKWRNDPAQACRPFDEAHEGFVWGQGSACVVLESANRERDHLVSGEIAGASLLLDGNHLPEPTVEGEICAMKNALASAGLGPEHIGYVNSHGTSSVLGDRIECAAIKSVFRDHIASVWINSTKSLTGHCFSASGVIELIASVLQLNHGFAHPNRNLDHPIDQELRFVGDSPEPITAEYALSNGFGFGGINSTVVVKRGLSDAGRN
jgi:malonyl-ACP decarboxylase